MQNYVSGAESFINWHQIYLSSAWVIYAMYNQTDYNLNQAPVFVNYCYIYTVERDLKSMCVKPL